MTPCNSNVIAPKRDVHFSFWFKIKQNKKGESPSYDQENRRQWWAYTRVDNHRYAGAVCSVCDWSTQAYQADGLFRWWGVRDGDKG